MSVESQRNALVGILVGLVGTETVGIVWTILAALAVWAAAVVVLEVRDRREGRA